MENTRTGEATRPSLAEDAFAADELAHWDGQLSRRSAVLHVTFNECNVAYWEWQQTVERYGFATTSQAIAAVGGALSRALGEEGIGRHRGSTHWEAVVPGVDDRARLRELLEGCVRELRSVAAPVARATAVGVLADKDDHTALYSAQQRMFDVMTRSPRRDNVVLLERDEITPTGVRVYREFARTARAVRELTVRGPAVLVVAAADLGPFGEEACQLAAATIGNELAALRDAIVSLPPKSHPQLLSLPRLVRVIVLPGSVEQVREQLETARVALLKREYMCMDDGWPCFCPELTGQVRLRTGVIAADPDADAEKLFAGACASLKAERLRHPSRDP